MSTAQLSFQFNTSASLPSPTTYPSQAREHPANNFNQMAGGEKGKARDIIAAIRTLKDIEQAGRPATSDERQTLTRFAGFGPVSLLQHLK